MRFAWLLPAEAALAFRTGEVDAWSVWEPYTSLEVLNFDARVLADARGLVPSASVLAVHNDALTPRREQLQDFVQRHERGWAWAQQNLREYARFTAQIIRQPVPVIERAYEVNQTRAVPIDDALVREFQTAVDQAHEWGVVPGRVNVAEAVDQSFSRGA